MFLMSLSNVSKNIIIFKHAEQHPFVQKANGLINLIDYVTSVWFKLSVMASTQLSTVCQDIEMKI